MFAIIQTSQIFWSETLSVITRWWYRCHSNKTELNKKKYGSDLHAQHSILYNVQRTPSPLTKFVAQKLDKLRSTFDLRGLFHLGSSRFPLHVHSIFPTPAQTARYCSLLAPWSLIVSSKSWSRSLLSHVVSPTNHFTDKDNEKMD